MDPTIVRRNDLFDRRAQLKAADKIFVWVAVGHLLAIPGILIWNGGLVGLWVSLVLALLVAIWMWLDGAWVRWRMRRRLRAAAAPSYAGDGKDPKIAAWLLVGDATGLAVDAQSRYLYFVTHKKKTEKFDRMDLRRIEARRRRNFLGRWHDVLFISDALAGPGRELRVTDGDLAAFMELAAPARRRLPPDTMASAH